MAKLGGLTVTGVLLSQSQTCLWREERGQSLVLVALRDDKSGETGHLVYELEVDKRDIMHEEARTDNPRLFANEHPEGDALMDLLAMADESTPTEMAEEIAGLLAACETPVIYDNGEAGWGLYAAE